MDTYFNWLLFGCLEPPINDLFLLWKRKRRVSVIKSKKSIRLRRIIQSQVQHQPDNFWPFKKNEDKQDQDTKNQHSTYWPRNDPCGEDKPESMISWYSAEPSSHLFSKKLCIFQILLHEKHWKGGFDSPLGSVEQEKPYGSERLSLPESEVKDTSYVLAGWNPVIIICCFPSLSSLCVSPLTFTSTAVHTPSVSFHVI